MARKFSATVALLGVSAIALAGCAGGGGGGSSADNTIDGEIAGDIKVITWRTDLIADGTFDEYAEAFSEEYPDVNVTFEGITDYEGEMKTRLSTTNYGDVIGIPTMQPSQFEQFLEPLGETADFEDTYRFLTTHTYDGTQYGLAIGGNANGVVYNKKVFEEAGVTAMPTSEAEWLEALQKVKDNTDAIPLYTNYKDGWPLSQSFSNLGSITDNPDAGIEMAETPEPWVEGSDIYAIDSLLYESVAAGLTEEDPLTTNWEQSKVDLGTGKIAAMTLGSWSISQMQAAAEDNGGSADDIGYMAFPSSVDGTQHADHRRRLQPRRQQALRVTRPPRGPGSSGSSRTPASPRRRAWSRRSRRSRSPTTSRGFSDAGVELMETNPAPAGKESLLSDVSNDSQIDLWGPLYRQKLVDIARGAADGDKESYFAELNERWAASSASLAG